MTFGIGSVFIIELTPLMYFILISCDSVKFFLLEIYRGMSDPCIFLLLLLINWTTGHFFSWKIMKCKSHQKMKIYLFLRQCSTFDSSSLLFKFAKLFPKTAHFFQELHFEPIDQCHPVMNYFQRMMH